MHTRTHAHTHTHIHTHTPVSISQPIVWDLEHKLVGQTKLRGKKEGKEQYSHPSSHPNPMTHTRGPHL